LSHFIRKTNNLLVERHYLGEILLKKVFNGLIIEVSTSVKMICVFFVNAIFAKKYSVNITIALSMNIGVVFAEN
jgi:hypothetical protein